MLSTAYQPGLKESLQKTIHQPSIIAAVVFSLVCGLFFAIYVECDFENWYWYTHGVMRGFYANEYDAGLFFRLCTMLVFSTALSFIFLRTPHGWLSYAYKFRYPIAAAIAVILIALGISGSSVDYWSTILGSDSSGTLFGVPRSLRSDEWLVTDTQFISQQYTGYSPTSDLLRGTETDASMVYGLPAWSLFTLFKPLLWGFLALGSTRGFSFLWVIGYMAIFFSGFEIAMLFTKNKWISATCAVVLSLSPIMQWWDCIQLMIYGQLLVIVLDKYLRATKRPTRIILVAILSWLCGCYLLALYPAWQVPLFYIFALLGAVVVVRYARARKNGADIAPFRPRFDVPLLITGVACFILAITIIFLGSMDTVNAMTHTVYPGNRLAKGGDYSLVLFNAEASIFYAAENASHQITNYCEFSFFFSLFPLGLILASVCAIKYKSKMHAALILLQLFFLAFGLLGFPGLLARITLLGNVPTTRLTLGVGYLDVILLFTSIPILMKHPHPKWHPAALLAAALAVTSLIIGACYIGNDIFPQYHPNLIFWILLFLVITCMLYAIFRISFNGMSSYLPFLLVIFVFTVGISGLSVHPVQQGTAALTESDLVQSVKEVDENDDGQLWIAEGWSPTANACLAAGASTVNSTNNYPDLERWESIDPDKQYEDIYNRYAHIDVDLVESDTSFELVQPDLFRVKMNFAELRTLGIKYCVSPEEYSGQTLDGVTFEKVRDSGPYKIYRLSY